MVGGSHLAELARSGCLPRRVELCRLRLYLERQAVDTTTPAGRAMFQMLGVFAEFERAIIQERVHAGIARARKNGTKSGKPIGRPRVRPGIEEVIAASLASGKGVIKTAREGARAASRPSP
jgi:DNA invertase Pin-like site-specific DNA recombinase